MALILSEAKDGLYVLQCLALNQGQNVDDRRHSMEQRLNSFEKMINLPGCLKFQDKTVYQAVVESEMKKVGS